VRALEMSRYRYLQRQRVHIDEPPESFAVDREAALHLILQAQAERRDLLLSEALSILEDYGIPAARSIATHSREEAEQAALEIGYPVAIKIISSQISHKTDVGGVQLNLRNADALGAAYDEMIERLHQAEPEAEIEGVLVQPMISHGRELILGGRQDPQFGPVVLVGLGGIFVEVFNDISVRVAPITRSTAVEMLEDLRGMQVLKGTRGHRPSDLDALIEALLRLSQLLCDFPQIKEVDINPLRVFGEGEGLQALDARMIVGN
jgi:acyl-CoA synthetase (NDP forming)